VHDALLNVAQLVLRVLLLDEEVEQVQHLHLVDMLVIRKEQVAHIRRVYTQLFRAICLLIFLVVEI